MNSTSHSSGSFHAWFAWTIRQLKRLISAFRTPEPRKRTLVSGKSRMIFGAYPYVVDTTENSTLPEVNWLSGTKR